MAVVHQPDLDSRVAAVAAQISVPRVAAADSFVLHAPLELLGRVGLLPFVDPDRREAALRAIEELGRRYEAAGAAVEPPRPASFADLGSAASALFAAIGAGDLAEVDRVAMWLTTAASAAELALLLGETVAPSLAAAGHAPIGLYLLQRVGGGLLPPTLLRGTLRELARHPAWRLTWFVQDVAERTGVASSSSADPMLDALVRIPTLGIPSSTFIHPTMMQVEDAGVAAALFTDVIDRVADGSLDVLSAQHTIMRVAAWSMVHDDPQHAPYGWTHCLTMPQAVMGLAGAGVTPRTAVAIAATHVAGFRASLSNTPFAASALDGWAGAHSDIDVTALSTFAALHHDAHLVKYTLASLLAVAADPTHRALHLTAAAHLADWWRAHPDAG